MFKRRPLNKNYDNKRDNKYHEQVTQDGILIKKKYGQHFLRNQQVVDHMISSVNISNACVFEIGCGDGFLTKSILDYPIKKLWVFEIDSEWAKYVKEKYPDSRLEIFEENFLDIDFSIFKPNLNSDIKSQSLNNSQSNSWVLLANLPYQITFPIFYLIQKNRDIIKEGVVMIQEEVAQKITKTHGRGFGYVSLFFQYYFELKKLDKISPASFLPPPKVFSRLLYFKPKQNIEPIINEDEFWKFIKACFHQPRRTLKNNLSQYQYDIKKIPENILQLRAQQMSIEELIKIWESL